jgi:biopolymer transport protein ExbD
VLVLLIIFMVVTPMIVSGVQVELPKTIHHEKKPDDGKDIIVGVTAKQEVYVMGKQMKSLDDVTAEIQSELRDSPGKTVYMKADARATYGVAREVMEKINKAGVENVLLGTDEIPTDNPKKHDS